MQIFGLTQTPWLKTREGGGSSHPASTTRGEGHPEKSQTQLLGGNQGQPAFPQRCGRLPAGQPHLWQKAGEAHQAHHQVQLAGPVVHGAAHGSVNGGCGRRQSSAESINTDVWVWAGANRQVRVQVRAPTKQGFTNQGGRGVPCAMAWLAMLWPWLAWGLIGKPGGCGPRCLPTKPTFS